MRMTPSDLRHLQTAIGAVLETHRGLDTLYRERGLPHMRYRWDILHASRFDTRQLYSYLNDDHIDTALRSILGPDYAS